MIIVAGALVVAPRERAGYLEGCTAVIEAARRAEGCHDFALSADLLSEDRINVYERWESGEHLRRFRGTGPSEEQADTLLDVRVDTWTVLEGDR